MTLQTLTGAGMIWPAPNVVRNNFATTTGTAFTIDASTEIGALIGRVWWPDRADTSKDISHIHFRAGAVTMNAASQYRVSLQDVSTSAGPPIQPDGTADQSFTSAVGTGPTANAWNRVALSSNRTVSPGALLAVVFDYTAFTATTSIVIQGYFSSSTALRPLQTDVLLYTGSWASQAMVPNVIFEFSDGTYGTFYGLLAQTSGASRSFNSGSTGSGGGMNAGDERGLEWTQEVPVTIDGCWLDIAAASGADFDIVLYEGTTALETVSVDSNAIGAAASTKRTLIPFASTHNLAASTLYRLMVKPTTTNNVTLETATFDNANHRVVSFGTGAAGNSRVDAGSFGTPSTTELPMMGIVISAVHDGAGGGGSGARSFGYIG